MKATFRSVSLLELTFHRWLLRMVLTTFGLSLNELQAQTNDCETSPIAADSVITLGTSTALSGPNQHLGVAMLTGLKKRIQLANDNNELNGKTIRLIELEDS